jgi:hypothetical protein
MRSVSVWLRWLTATLLVMTGCLSHKPNLRPPKRPEEFILPPETEARFSKPITYPEGTPNSSTPKKKLLGNQGPVNNPSGFGVGPGGMGGGMGAGGAGMRPY